MNPNNKQPSDHAWSDPSGRSQASEVISEEENEYEEVITAQNFNLFFELALKQTDLGNIEEALLIFKALVVRGSQIYNSDISVNLALVYFQIGHIMLEQVEKDPDEQSSAQNRTPSGVSKRVKSDQGLSKLDIQLSVHSFASLDPRQKGTDDPPKFLTMPLPEQDSPASRENEASSLSEFSQNQNDIETLQVAWENLEFCRLSLTKYLDEQTNLLPKDRQYFLSHLSNCHLRMGDCDSQREEFGSALEEYQTALSILQQLEGGHYERRIAELLFLIGNTYFYLGNYQASRGVYIQGKSIIENLLAQIRESTMKRLCFSELNDDFFEELNFISKSFDFRIRASTTLLLKNRVARKRKIRKEKTLKNARSSSHEQ